MSLQYISLNFAYLL